MSTKKRVHGAHEFDPSAPVVKAEQLAPIREKTRTSVLDKLHRTDAELKARRQEHPGQRRKNRGMEL